MSNDILILQLAEIISQSVSTITSACKEHGFQFPSINSPHSSASDAFRSHPASAEAANTAAAAALQLAAALLPPQQSIFHIVSGHLKTAALGASIRCHVPEILSDAGENGLHVNDIALKTNTDGVKLGRLLRMLANHHVYREVEPDVFAHTRISSVLNTGKSLDSILNDPGSKHDGTSGFVAFAEHGSSVTPKASTALYSSLTLDPYRHSEEPTHAPFHLAYQVDYPFWTWLEQPEHAYELRRFGLAMRGIGSMQPADVILNAFPWRETRPDSIIVDVGAGIGTSAMLIAKHHPHVRLVVQDRDKVVQDAKTHWLAHLPEVVKTGRVAFQDADFFSPQPPLPFNGVVSVFILKNILHNWSNKYATILLKHLRHAASRDTKLLIIGTIMGNLCRDSASDGYQQAPPPLLPNYGAANEMAYTVDMTMMMLHNAQERTLGQMSSLLEKAGWKIEKVMRGSPPNNFFDPVIAVPIFNAL